MSAVVLRGDARDLPLPDASVDLIVTSPPYFGLRSYTDGGEHYAGQIGSETTPAEYVAALTACTREWVRVLKPSGSLFVNLGDRYAGGGMGGHKGGTIVASGQSYHEDQYAAQRGIGPAKSLLGLPWRYALACTDQLGLILRAEIIWSKPNGLPESVTDRVRRSHEQWFHFTMRPRYYSAVDEIREPHIATLTGRNTTGWQHGPSGNREIGRGRWTDERTHNDFATSPLGKLPGSVWDIPSQPLTVPASLGVDHFAAFPMELPRRIIQGWSPPGICVACGQGRRPVSATDYEPTQRTNGAGKIERNDANNFSQSERPHGRARSLVAVTGYACNPNCPDPYGETVPAVVLDPFGGTGTTALIADAYGRHGITIDRSADYCRLAAWRTRDPGQRAAALQVPRPPAEVNGQGDMLELLG